MMTSCGFVLLVDDDEDIRDVISLLLTARGYQVIALADGQEALDWLRQGERPCVILLDLMMPGMNGWEFREHQLADAELADIPVVILSGAGSLSSHVETLRPEGVLAKPVDLSCLTQAVASHC
jgi:two-component system, chemotaxis family, chemotaxis protein CheY